MLFRSRETPKLHQRLRVWAWPRVSWSRSLRYFSKRVLRLTASPHAVSAGVAAGVFSAITPFVGFHFIIAFIAAFIIRGNMIAAALGTMIGNPLTFPFFWAASFEIGQMLLGRRHRMPPPIISEGLLHQSFAKILPILKPLILGSIPLALAGGALTYVVVRLGVNAYQKTRRARLAERKRESMMMPPLAKEPEV